MTDNPADSRSIAPLIPATFPDIGANMHQLQAGLTILESAVTAHASRATDPLQSALHEFVTDLKETATELNTARRYFSRLHQVVNDILGSAALPADLGTPAPPSIDLDSRTDSPTQYLRGPLQAWTIAAIGELVIAVKRLHTALRHTPNLDEQQRERLLGATDAVLPILIEGPVRQHLKLAAHTAHEFAHLMYDMPRLPEEIPPRYRPWFPAPRHEEHLGAPPHPAVLSAPPAGVGATTMTLGEHPAASGADTGAGAGM
jgi:hypothetical protein